MSTIAGNPPPIQNTVPAHAPIGKPAVGLESVADKDSPLPPVEDATDAERLHHRDVIVKLSEDAERDRHRREHADHEADEEAPADEPQAPAAPNPYQARHIADFSTYADPHTLPPGSLLDQEI